MSEPLCHCGHSIMVHNGDEDDDRCYECSCWQFQPTGETMSEQKSRPMKPHTPGDGTQRKSSNPKDVLAREEQRVLLHLLPSPGLIHAALAMMDGAKKYGAYNFREEGVGAGTYVSAALRHIRDWLDGEEVAPDSEIHHLGHAVACLLILMDAQAVGNLVDDRPPYAPTSEMMEDVKETGRVSGEEDLKLDEAIAEMPDYIPNFPCQRDLSAQAITYGDHI